MEWKDPRPQEPTDLGPVLGDAYLVRAGFGQGCESVELGFHVLRRVLGAREDERDRTLALRFSGVLGLATEATRWDRDEARWVQARQDWLGGLSRGLVERPIVSGALLRAPASLARWRKGAGEALWLRGTPEEVLGGAFDDAPIVCEVAAEVALPNGWHANGRIFVAAAALELATPRRALADVGEALRWGAEWTGRWQAYWARKARQPEMPEDPQFEWTVPEGA